MDPPLYVPAPIATEGVALPRPILALMEELSRNAHEVWAAGRIRNGWTFGPARDDVRKEHPNLVPYDKLTDDERQMDRDAVGETLKAILVLGYRIEKS